MLLLEPILRKAAKHVNPLLSYGGVTRERWPHSLVSLFCFRIEWRYCLKILANMLCMLCCVSDGSSRKSQQDDSIYVFGMQFAEHLANGLADNWSQVRLAGSQATRQFLMAMNADSRDPYLPLLLPRMCLNRSVYRRLLYTNWYE